MHLSIRDCPSAERPPLRHSRYCRKTIYSGRPSACHTRNGFDRVYRILQQLFSRLSTASQLPQPPGQKALPLLPSEQNAAKRHFTENERPDILNRTVPYQYTAQTYGKPQKIRPHTAASNLSRFVNKRSLRLYMRYAITLLSHRSEKCGQARSRARSLAAAAAVFRQVAPSEFSKNDKLNTFLRYALQQQLFLNAAPYICAAQIQSANAIDHKIPSASPCQTVYNSQH